MTNPVSSGELLVDAKLVRLDDRGAFSTISDAAVALKDGRISWFGVFREIPSEFANAPRFELGGRLIAPGLVECHTHLVHAGDREEERRERARGEATYQEQLARGDGIYATVRKTRAAGEAELLESALGRARQFTAQGVTTIEIKSGYGMDVATELVMLRIAARVGDELGLQVVRTLLAGHTYPLDTDRAEFVEFVCQSLLPAARSEALMDAVEVCCDDIVGLDLDDSSTILETAYRWKVPTRMQSDFLTDSAGSALAPAFYAKAAAHLLNTDALAIRSLADSHTTAILLPAAVCELALETRPPVETLREEHVPMAVSSGYNPGTAPLPDLLRAARLSIEIFGLTNEEAFAGITRAAAGALGLNDGQGDIRVGGVADFSIWNVTSPQEILGATEALCWGTLAAKRGLAAAQLRENSRSFIGAV